MLSCQNGKKEYNLRYFVVIKTLPRAKISRKCSAWWASSSWGKTEICLLHSENTGQSSPENDDWNIDHTRWPERCLLKRRDHFLKELDLRSTKDHMRLLLVQPFEYQIQKSLDFICFQHLGFQIIPVSENGFVFVCYRAHSQRTTARWRVWSWLMLSTPSNRLFSSVSQAAEEYSMVHDLHIFINIQNG